MRQIRLGILFLLLVGGFSLSAIAAGRAGPIEPRDTLSHFQLDPGLAIELVAAEPQIVDPVAIRFDEDGRLWVAEMRDYPNGPAPGGKPQSRISVLKDTDGDGFFETAQVFAEGLLFVTGMQPWRGGVIVTLSGQVVYLKDTNGDGRSDLHEVWYTGFKEENPQLRANHPRLTIDGRVVIANGLRGGVVSDPRRPKQQPVSISGMDFAFDPLTGDCEAISGNGQFGSTFDDYGRRFVCSNRNPVSHVVLENRHLARNPLYGAAAVMNEVALSGEKSRVFPLIAAWTTSNLHAGQFTAACGVHLFRGDALPDEYRGNAFTCEPTGSLVHREILEPTGATFTSHVATEGREFLASTDPWFKPVNMEDGPDGALYVVDMYRAVIEHPQFMPDELKNRPDLRLGDDRGRIYRIVAKGVQVLRERPELSQANDDQLVFQFDRRNAWWRETAARLLLERQGRGEKSELSPSAMQALNLKLARPSDDFTRIHTLWTLAQLGKLPEKVLESQLNIPSAAVREHALQIDERLGQNRPQRNAARWLLPGDVSPRVRFQVALRIGDTYNPAALGLIGAMSPADVWTRRAVASAVSENAAGTLQAALDFWAGNGNKLSPENLDGACLLAADLAGIVGQQLAASKTSGTADPKQLQVLDAAVAAGNSAAQVRLRQSVLIGLAKGLERKRSSLSELSQQTGVSTATRERLQAMLESAIATAGRDKQVEDERLAAIEFLRYWPQDKTVEVLSLLVQNSPSQAIRLKAIETLPISRQPGLSEMLLADFKSQTPTVRKAVLDAVLSTTEGAKRLLDGLTSKAIAPAELDPVRTNRLLQHRDPAIREAATKLLAGNISAERKKVLEDYQVTLTLNPDAKAGKEVFRKNCAACHHVGDVGVNVAPDISDARTKKPEQLLTDILNPNRAIDNNFMAYVVQTADGKSYSGIIVAETASSVTLKQPENKQVELLRQDIEVLRSTGVSLMPEGLEKQIPPQDMANLIGYIKNWRYLDGSVPLGSANK